MAKKKKRKKSQKSNQKVNQGRPIQINVSPAVTDLDVLGTLFGLPQENLKFLVEQFAKKKTCFVIMPIGDIKNGPSNNALNKNFKLR